MAWLEEPTGGAICADGQIGEAQGGVQYPRLAIYHTHKGTGGGLEGGPVVRATGSFPSTQVVARMLPPHTVGAACLCTDRQNTTHSVEREEKGG